MEWLHWQSEVKVARAALHAEIADNNAIFLTRRVAIAPCVERQAQEAGRILDDLEAKRPPGRFTAFQPENGSLLNFNEWESERAAQTLTHFPREELALIGRYYDQLADDKSWMLNEAGSWHELSILRHPPGEIDISDILRLRTALENAEEDERLIVLNARRQLSWSGQLGIAAKPFDPRAVGGILQASLIYARRCPMRRCSIIHPDQIKPVRRRDRTAFGAVAAPPAPSRDRAAAICLRPPASGFRQRSESGDAGRSAPRPRYGFRRRAG